MNCDGTTNQEVNIPGTVIISPGYPGNYSDNMDCTTTIRFAEGERVLLEVISFNLEHCGDYCGCDKLEIRDGDNAYASRFKCSMCGSSSNCSTIVSSGNAVYMNFVTDGSVTYSGFEIRAIVAGKSYFRRYNIFSSPLV